MIDLNRVQNAATPNVKYMIDNFLGNLKTSPTTTTQSKLYRELSDELKIIQLNIGSIDNNQFSNIRALMFVIYLLLNRV